MEKNKSPRVYHELCTVKLGFFWGGGGIPGAGGAGEQPWSVGRSLGGSPAVWGCGEGDTPPPGPSEDFDDGLAELAHADPLHWGGGGG